MVGALIKAGAQVNMSNINRVTPLSIAAQKGHTGESERKEREERRGGS